LHELLTVDLPPLFSNALSYFNFASQLRGAPTVWPWQLAVHALPPQNSFQTTPHSRRLLAEDTFANSLKYVNILYTKTFGAESRRVPAHMPHMIDKHIMTELQQTWPERFDATSSHRFRHSQDMQFMFSYAYFMINVKHVFNLETMWKEELDPGFEQKKKIQHFH
jgi:UDP-N-acetylglucosamine-lysosomal-enzyme